MTKSSTKKPARPTKKTTAKVKLPVLVNAKAMAQQHPETFNHPNARIVRKLAKEYAPLQKTHMLAFKVAIPGERFWVLIDKLEFPFFEGIIDNDLIRPTDIACGDRIRLHADNVYDFDLFPNPVKGSA